VSCIASSSTLWKALILLANGPPDHAETGGAAQVLDAVLADHRGR
jgi:hypothetical protein